MRNPEEAQEEGGPMGNVDAQDGIQDKPDRLLMPGGPIPAEECFNLHMHDLQSPATSSAAGADITSHTPSEVAPSSATPDEGPTSVGVAQDTRPYSSSFVSGMRKFNIAIQHEHNRQDNNLDNNNRDEDQ